MAKLIPARSTCLHRMTSGEKRVSERLEQKLEDDYLLWYDVPIGLRYSKPDFVIFHPRRGLLVLEVKDWKIDTIKAFDRTSFTLITDRGLVQALNPLAQARMYALEICVVLERDPQLLHPPESKYGGKLLTPWGFGVVLTNITRQQFDASGMGDVIQPHLVICQDEIAPRVEAEAIQSRLWNMFPWQFSHALSLPQIERVRWHLFPEVRVAPGEGQFGLFEGTTSSTSRIEIPDLIRVMDVQQEQLARSIGDGHRIIHGVAGSGKTMILGYRCVHLAKFSSKPILVLCFNKTLAARLQQLIGERGLSEKVQVYNFHSWCSSQIKAYNLIRPSGKGVFDKLVTTVVDGVDSGLVPRGQYGAILVDEGHDFEPDWYALIAKMVDPERNSLLVLYDDAQNIYGKATRRKFTWKSVGIDAVGHTTILRLNYRNTLELLSVAKAFVTSVVHGDDEDDEGVPLITPESAGRRGPLPELIRADDRSEESRIVIARIRDHLGDGRSPSDIAVITRHERDAEYFHSALGKSGLPSRLADEKGKGVLFLGDPSVKVMTMHSSKGLEFPIVFIPGLGDMPGKSEDAAREAKLLYVAMTRATELATVMHDRESEFSARLSSAIENARMQ